MKRVVLPERPDWRDRAEALGFGFHRMYGEPYWDDATAMLLTLEEAETRIEDPTAELHAMCLDTVDAAVRDERILDTLLIPRSAHDLVRRSWIEGDRHLYGRFDLAYDGNGPAKMLEYNADTPTGVFETAFFQHGWLVDRVESGWLPPHADQFNSLQESLVEVLSTFDRDTILHFACATDDEEERGTTAYLRDCAVQAGLRTHMIDVRGIGVDPDGRFTDDLDRTVDACFKLYPWEDMLREPFAKHLRPGVFVEPAWKACLSTKALLPLLWERHPGHPNLLAAYFEADPLAEGITDAVSKPVHGREGEDVALVRDGEVTTRTDGTRGDEVRVVQERAPLFRTGDRHAVIGSWVVGDRACGMAVREDDGPITRDMSRFVPHAIVGEGDMDHLSTAGRDAGVAPR